VSTAEAERADTVRDEEEGRRKKEEEEHLGDIRRGCYFSVFSRGSRSNDTS
jgi:hypothetical protein